MTPLPSVVQRMQSYHFACVVHPAHWHVLQCTARPSNDTLCRLHGTIEGELHPPEPEHQCLDYILNAGITDLCVHAALVVRAIHAHGLLPHGTLVRVPWRLIVVGEGDD